MKVEIGCKYDGPSLDRPCLRQLPRHWVLEETKESVWIVVARWIARLVTG